MESKLRGASLVDSFKIMGPLFYVPLILMIAGGLSLLFLFEDQIKEFSDINKWFGIVSIPFAPIWILSYLKEFVDKHQKEWILYLPYCNKYAGYKRILSFTFIFSMVFDLFFVDHEVHAVGKNASCRFGAALFFDSLLICVFFLIDCTH